MGSTLSTAEREQNAIGPDKRPVNSMLDLKESLNMLFRSFVGTNPQRSGPHRNFRLVYKHKDYNHDNILLTTALRHDRDTGAILLDGYVIPLTGAYIPELILAAKSLHDTQPINIVISEPESILWKHLLPALVERCRHGWTHRPKCEYRVLGRIPLGTAFGDSPICECGAGKSMDGFPVTQRGCALFAKYATRIAIPPIFAVPYVESVVPREFRGRVGAYCGYCGSVEEGLKACMGCEVVKYCNRECQKKAWWRHKLSGSGKK